MSAATPAPVVLGWCRAHNGPRFKGYPWCQYAADAGRREQVPPCEFVSLRLVDPSALVVERPDGFTDAEWESANGYFTDLFSQFLAGGARRDPST